MAQDLRLDQLLRDARGVGQPDAISAPKASELAGDLGPSTASFTRYSAHPKPEEWFDTPWGTRATDSRMIDPNSIMGIVRALGVNPRDVVLASATSAGIPGMWREPSEISRTRLWIGWDTLSDDRWSALRKIGMRLTADQAREEETEQLWARNAALETRLAEMERASQRARRV